MLGLVAAGYWFGASGVALGVLWWRARAARPAPAVTAPEVDELLDSPTLKAVHLTPWRARFIDRRFGDHEVFIDEVSPRSWARLRRRVIALQLD